jgi:hypothetical protein
MTTKTLIGSDRYCAVQLKKGSFWLRLVLWLGDEYTRSNLIHLADDARFSIDGADKMSSAYKQINWESGLISGALYALRTLNIRRQRVVLGEFTGRLDSAGMEAVANATALAIAKLANRDLPIIGMDDWQTQLEIGNRVPPPPLSINWHDLPTCVQTGFRHDGLPNLPSNQEAAPKPPLSELPVASPQTPQ